MKIWTAICAAAIAICGTVYAQNAMDNINVRFATPVVVGETTIPAGDCNIQVMRGSSDNVVLVLRGQNGVNANVLVNRLNDMDVDFNDHVNVILNHRTDNRYQLVRILLPDHTGFQVIE
jgi:hypothetical protein